MKDPKYYAVQSSKLRNNGRTDPFFYELGSAPNMENQPWFLQPSSGNPGYHPSIVSSYQPITLGGGEPILKSADYQGRRWINSLGEISYSGLGEAGTVKCMALCALVSAGVAYAVSKYSR